LYSGKVDPTDKIWFFIIQLVYYWFKNFYDTKVINLFV
jgi:hypothetical protein